MNPRERVLAALAHREPDRVPIDFGGTIPTGIAGTAYECLKSHLGIQDGPTRILDCIQQLAKPELRAMEAMGGDVLSASPSSKKWKMGKLLDGTPCEVPEWFSPDTLSDGSQVLRDDSGRVIGKMPKDGFYFDSTYYPLEDVSTVEELRGLDDSVFGDSMWKSSSLPDQSYLDKLRQNAKHLYRTTDYALVLGSGGIYEWAQFLRGWSNFMMDLAANPRFAEALLDRLLEICLARLELTLPAVDGYVQVFGTGDDLGIQDGPQMSPELYRRIVKPRHARLYRYIKEHTSAYLWLHTCGSVYEFIPDFIEMGVDIINPVQVGAKDMDSKRLKKEFGRDITFWGGGADPQKALAFGTPEEVRDEVKRRIDDFAPGGGFVFTHVNPIQAGTPPENIVAMYETALEYGHY